MQTIRGLDVHYDDAGEGPPVLLLHGWGGSSKSMAPIKSFLCKNYRVISLDLPGFGESGPPGPEWASTHYAALVVDLLHCLALKRVAIIGHSFGGKVAIHLATMEKAAALILVNSAGIRPKRSLRYHMRVGAFKLAKRLSQLRLLKKMLGDKLDSYKASFGSSDYKNASPLMRQILVRVVNEDMSPLLSRITVPTLLVWGDRDTATPLKDAKQMEQSIPDCGLVVFDGAGHFSYLDRPRDFEIIIKRFLDSTHADARH